MDHAEEQEMEMEALSAIFGADFSQSSPTSLALSIVPNQGEDESSNHVALTLEVTFPATYPEVKPAWSIPSYRGLVSDQISQLSPLLDACCDESLGAPAVFALGELAREWLADRNEPGQADESMYGQMMRKAQEAAKAKVMEERAFEEQGKKDEVGETEKREMEILKKRAEGTQCTTESFAAWKGKFDAEMEEVRRRDKEELLKDRAAAVMAARKTGYDIFAGKGSLEDLERMAETAAEAEVTEEELGEWGSGDEDLSDLGSDLESDLEGSEEEPDI